MKRTHLLTQTLTLVAVLLLHTGAAHAGLYHVTISTSTLNLPVNSGNKPFSLDFQLNDGGVLGNNTATISNFNYGGGSATGSPVLLGGATGNIGSTVTLNNSSAFQELFQTFTPGTRLGFDVSLTQNVDGITPDAFAIAILDSNLANIPTTGFGDTLLFANIDTTRPLAIAQLNLASGTGTYEGVTAAASVPQGDTYALVLAGLGLLGFIARRRKLRA